MENINRTVYAALIQTAAYLGVAAPILENTTLNEALDIMRSDRPGPNERPTVSIFVWGNLGQHYIAHENGGFENYSVLHRSTDANLYGLMPFVLRELNDDLPPTARVNYALRKQVTINGRNYIAYYGRRFSKENVVPVATYVTVSENGETTATAFNPTRANLNPVKPVYLNNGTWATSGDYVTVKAHIELVLNAAELQEMRNAVRIIYGSESFASMTEIGVCTCVDRVVRATGAAGATFNFNEAIACQVASHMNVNFDLKSTNDYLSIEIDVGANEPLYKITPADTAANVGGFQAGAIDGGLTFNISTPKP